MEHYTPEPWDHPGFNSPILAFEFVRNIDDYYHVMKATSTLGQRSFNTVNYIDFVFLTCYGLYLLFYLKGLYRHFPHWSIRLAVFLAIIAPLADAIENIQMIRLTDHYLEYGDLSSPKEAWVEYLRMFTWIKWLSLGLIFFLLGIHIFLYKWANYLIAIILCFPIILGIASGINSQASFLELFALSIFACFFLLMILSIFFKRKAGERRVKP